ncbi:polyketide synthase [Dictyobacter alpinus]|uniref:Phenolphthiocerol/phthiocerol polyketide synthase subunit E n=1 Tax=Dictyobacter alpinus TaxID=2014873 RepID=A0A402BB31_9CHLR|nr:type I polyketide synthase [Dictyobacter alpinus]GCE28516.1 polyketide synthase [Dictyobacter alpinus]
MNDATLSEMDIAIIGMSGRFPGAQNIQQYWQNLCAGVESIRPVSDEQLRETFRQTLGYVPETIVQQWLQDPHYIKVAAALEDIDRFDASFFGYSPAEAETIDPQQRLFLEQAWEALEDAGYADTEAYAGLIGVYAGTEVNSYHRVHTSLIPTARDFQALVGNESAYLTTRASYKLHLTGPSIDVQTACSTSLVALHLASQSLRDGECDIALAGGVVAYSTQKVGYFYQEGGMFSADGHCRPFDARANGVVFANGGVGIVVLKRLHDAYRDGDQIYAVIKASAINNDGGRKAGYTAPSIEGQKRVILEALALADARPEDISYIEAHGTATPLGDPIEIAALTQGFREHTHRSQFCALGSVKSNIGHLGVAAGIAGIIKTALALKHKMLPPSLHYEQANPHIDFEHSPFYVNTRLTPWTTAALPRRAGVSSFGIGGTNAHVILQEAPEQSEPTPTNDQYQLIVLSARSGDALDTLCAHLSAHIEQTPDLSLANLAYTLQVGRKAFPYRRAIVCRTLTELRDRLTNGEYDSVQAPSQKPSIAFLFSGQGSQYSNMGRDLYEHEPVFRHYVDLCASLVQPELECDIRAILYPADPQDQQAVAQLQQTSITQPALFIIEYALAQLWMSWNVLPDIMIGHSIGEYVAACLAGVFSLEDALALVVSRGRLMQAQPPGAMLSVSAPYHEIESLLGPEVSLAAQNGPEAHVLSGSVEAIEELEQRLQRQGLVVQRLRTSHAFHSQMMDPVLTAFRTEVQKIQLHTPKIPFISNLTGALMTEEAATDPQYWVSHLRQCVRFAAGLQTILQSQQCLLIEVGPGRSLAGLARAQLTPDSPHLVVSSLRHVRDQQHDQAALLQTCGKLWCSGVRIDWARVQHEQYVRRISLPTYPFERKRYWHFPQSVQAAQSPELVGSRKSSLDDWFYAPSWKRLTLPVDQQSSLPANTCLLAFQDSLGLTQKLSQEATASGMTVIIVQAGTGFQQSHEKLYTIDPTRKEYYQQLLQTLKQQGYLPHIIFHCWTMTPFQTDPSRMEQVEQAQYSGFYSLLFLSQALDSLQDRQMIKLMVVSNNLEEVIGGESYAPERATVLGTCRSIPLEYAQIECQHIDIQLPQPGLGWQSIAQSLLQEIYHPADKQTIAYRGGYRWLSCFEPASIPADSNRPSGLRPHGVYLITGGFGAIGLALALEIARQTRGHIILLGRTPFPARSTWAEWLATHDGEEKVSRQIRQLQALEELGATLTVESADVTDHASMRTLLARVQQQYGLLHGVIHAAGTLDIGIMQFKTARDASRVLAPKLQGTLILAELLREQRLDFLLLCSSLYSLFGGLGQADYSAANAFLDRFALSYQRQSGTPTYVINWDAWQGAGMAEESSRRNLTNQQYSQFLMEGAISPSEGREIFSRVLSQRIMSQSIISTRDLRRVFEQIQAAALQFKHGYSASSVPGTMHKRPDNLHVAYLAPNNATEESIAAIWHNILGIEQIGVQDNFFDLGGDSIMAIKILKACLDTFKIELSIQQFFASPTIAHQARLVLSKQMESLDHEQLADFLQELQDMSEEDVMALLEASEDE